MGALANAANNQFAEIHLLLSTPGGNVAQGITLYNFIRALPVKVTIYNIGTVNSIGNIVFQAAHKRIASPNSSFMFHGVGFFIENQHLELSHLEDKLEGLKNDQSLILSIMSERTKMNIAEIEDLFRKMAFINAQEALKRGISDEIAEVHVPTGIEIQQLIFQS